MVRYLYVTDQLQTGDVNRVTYNPTEEIKSDYLTKALQEKLFHTNRKTPTGLEGIDAYMFYKKYKNERVWDYKYYIIYIINKDIYIYVYI